MNRFLSTTALSFFIISFFFSEALAQAPATPLLSPPASITQVVGISEVSVKYSRPSVRGRVIFGGLVPYGEVWRTGANNNTTISFTNEATVGNSKIPAGTYGLFTIPGEKEWTVIFSKDNANWGAFSYKMENDAARFTVKPEKIQPTEQLTFNFETVDENKTRFTIAWSDVKIGFDIAFNTHQNVLDKLKNDVSWAAPVRGAEYLLKSGKDLDLAMKYADIALSIDENYNTLKVKAQLLVKTGDKKGAITLMEKAVAKGAQMKNPPFDFEDMKKLLEEWKK